MSVFVNAGLDHASWAVGASRGEFEPEGVAHRELVGTGDGSAGIVRATFDMRIEHVYKVTAWSIQVGNSTPMQLGIRMEFQWLLAVRASTTGGAEWQLSAASGTDSNGTGRTNAQFWDLPNVPLANPNALPPTVTTADVQLIAATNLTGVTYRFNLYALFWRREVFGQAGFLAAFRRA